MQRAGGKTCEPTPSGLAGRARLRCQPRWCKPQSFDDLAVPGAPEPGPSRDQRVRDVERERAARKRQSIPEEMRAKLRQKPIGAGAVGGGIDKPAERRGKLHREIMAWLHFPCHGLSLSDGNLRSARVLP
jgi:hypothetical protein